MHDIIIYNFILYYIENKRIQNVLPVNIHCRYKCTNSPINNLHVNLLVIHFFFKNQFHTHNCCVYFCQCLSCEHTHDILEINKIHGNIIYPYTCIKLQDDIPLPTICIHVF